MYQIIKLLAVMPIIMTSYATFGQKNVVKDTITVQGICGMCKSRIEEAAYGKGVKFAEWDNLSSKLTIVYRGDKTTLEEIETRVSKAGHSTERKKAARKDYDTLPACCRYEELDKH